MLKRAVAGDSGSNTARFKQLFQHLLNCGDRNCAVPGCLAGRDVLCHATDCRDCHRVSACGQGVQRGARWGVHMDCTRGAQGLLLCECRRGGVDAC